MERLIDNLDEALRAIDKSKGIPLAKSDIDTLLKMGLIKHNFSGGWIPSGTGREYLRRVKKPG
jgi:hypothetical protein